MNSKGIPYLDFERPIEEIVLKIEELTTQAESENLDMSAEIEVLKQRLKKTEAEIYDNLSAWQRVQVARHPNRPYTLDYVDALLTDFTELHGDRLYSDDPAMIAGLGRLDGRPVVVVGQQKGRNTKENLHRNFGMAHPEGYRKALRLIRMAEKFQRPVICLIDTPGAYPGIGSEERSVSEAIARNLFEIARLRVPIVVAIIGEGASGGALGIGVGDTILMMEQAWYSVINPESCSLILWRNRDQKEVAAENMKLAAHDLLELGIVDQIVPEPVGGAHRNPAQAAENLKRAIVGALEDLRRRPIDRLVPDRIEKFAKMGRWEE